MTKYNLFSPANNPECVRAVAVDCPVPPFIKGPYWKYAGESEDQRGLKSLPTERCATPEACARQCKIDSLPRDGARKGLPEWVLPTASEPTARLTHAPNMSLMRQRATHA